jgi:hypothetical protein
MAGGHLDKIRDIFRDDGLDAVWKWAMEGNGAHGKWGRFDACAEFARKHKAEADSPEEKRTWAERQEDYHREAQKWEKKYRARKDVEWPKHGSFTELMYHHPGPHIHAASADRGFLVQIAKIGQEKFGQRIGEFPGFDPVECVHVSGSWHYRDSSAPWAARLCANRGNGLAFDANDADGGSDQEFAFYLELKRRYA